MVVLYNKNDLEEIYPTDFLTEYLGLAGYDGFSTCALTGDNLEEALVVMLRKLTANLKEKGFEVA